VVRAQVDLSATWKRPFLANRRVPRHWESESRKPPRPQSPPRFLYIRWTLRDGGARLTHFTQIIGFPKDSQISSSNRWWFQLAGNWQPTQPRAALTLCPGTFHADPRPPSKVCRTLQGHSRYPRYPTYRLVSGTVCEEGGKMKVT
jgi:hypothetical protein